MNDFRLGSYLRLKLLEKELQNLSGITLLDVGCNYGEILEGVPKGNEIIGVDTDKRALDKAKKRFKRGKFILGSATKIPLRGKSVDVVTCLAVLEHIKDDQKAISEMSRVLKKDGKLVLAIPTSKFRLIPGFIHFLIVLFNKIFKTKFPTTDKDYVHFGQEGIGHVRWGYTKNQVREMLKRNNFKIKSFTTYWHFPSRTAYLFLAPLLKKKIISQSMAKKIFNLALFFDRFIRDEKGDFLIFAQKNEN